MTPKQLKAVDLLMQRSDFAAALELGVNVETLRKWMRRPEFIEAMSTREREQRASASRLARHAAVRAAESLCALFAKNEKCDAKLLLDILKTAGLFDVENEESYVSLEQVFREAEKATRQSGADE